MKDQKLGISVAFLSAFCYFLGYYSITFSAVVLVLVLALAEAAELKKNAAQAFTFAAFVYVIQLVLDVLSSKYQGLLGKIYSKGNFDYDLYDALSSIDVCRFLSTLVGLAAFVFMIIFVIASLKGKNVKIPVVSKLVDKALN